MDRQKHMATLPAKHGRTAGQDGPPSHRHMAGPPAIYGRMAGQDGPASCRGMHDKVRGPWADMPSKKTRSPGSLVKTMATLCQDPDCKRSAQIQSKFLQLNNWLPSDHNGALTAPEIPRDVRLSFSYIIAETLVVYYLCRTRR